LNAKRGASKVVLLTLLGGGAFGNEESWILGAMQRALDVVSSYGLDVKIVSFNQPSRAVFAIAESFRC
jgi:hypothetical protein